jgi:hypothetical protein
MPKNMTGGSGHRSQRNSEGSKAKHNRCLIDDLLEDVASGEVLTDVFVGRVTKRMGQGRMEVFYMDTNYNPPRALQMIAPMRGGLRGKGKKTVWVDLNSLVMIAETGLAGTTHEIVGVFSPIQVSRYRKLVPDADPRLFLTDSVEVSKDAEEQGFEFEGAPVEDEEDIDIDNI